MPAASRLPHKSDQIADAVRNLTWPQILGPSLARVTLPVATLLVVRWRPISVGRGTNLMLRSNAAWMASWRQATEGLVSRG